ncbi:MAG: alpha/beta hydrolase, partial [Bacteroidetes bacterium]|nr:alpha/beta hydrolase [Bacteroidota bacterium]
HHPKSNQWVVFIHGAGGSSAIWHKQIKPFSNLYNILLVDLRGHGKSKLKSEKTDYSFEVISKDVVEVLKAHQIQQAHLVGVSMGSIVIKQIYNTNPELVKSMIFAGAVTKLNIKSRFLLRLGRVLNRFLPYMTLYRLFARIMMPKKNHEQSRKMFIQEARKLMDKEFKRWFKLTARLTAYLHLLENKHYNIPQLYIMGSEDHLFLNPVLELTRENKYSTVSIVENCGHVVNIEDADRFNSLSIEFIERIKE